MIYIVTAVHNRYEITKKFIENLKQQSYTEYRLLLIDDGSTDCTAQMVKKELSDSVILYGNGNLWWGGALHKAYQYFAEHNNICDYVMFANDDTTFDKYFLEKAIDYLRKYPNNLISACGYDINSERLLDAPVRYDVETGEIERLEPGSEGNCGTTRSLFMTYNTLLDIGGFHPILLPHYASDYEFTIRAGKKGHAIISFTDLKYYFDPGTTGHNEHLSGIHLSKLFSKRSRFNPFYRISFMFLVTPLRYIPMNITQGLKRAFKELRR